MGKDQASIGIIGGTGLYEIDGMETIKEISIDTPFGAPSDKLILCQYNGRKVVFLPRHGRGHKFLPTDIPVKANVYALKSLGVKNVIAVSAVGSLKEEIQPKHFVIPDQIIDRTRSRDNSFFGNGIAGHVSFADPYCQVLSDIVYEKVQASNITTHKGGIYLCMEGPLFSTRAESNLYRSWGCSVIGMTALPEAKLIREAEMCYCSIAMSTDYDCWHDIYGEVTIDMVMQNMAENIDHVKKALLNIISEINDDYECKCQSAAEFAIMTASNLIPEKTKKELELFYGKYYK